MTHCKIEPYTRRHIIWFVINFRAYIYIYVVTATLITVGHIITVRNERLIFCTFTVSGRITATISLAKAPVIRMASALVKRARDVFIIAIFRLHLLLIAVLA